MTEHIEQIQSGVFIMPFHDPAKPLAQCFDEDLELIIRADELGFDEFWIGEHHTMKYEPIVMPEIFIARALGETEDHPHGSRPGLPAAAPPGARRRAGWRFSIIFPRAGSTCASARAASRPTRSCTASTPKTAAR